MYVCMCGVHACVNECLSEYPCLPWVCVQVCDISYLRVVQPIFASFPQTHQSHVAHSVEKADAAVDDLKMAAVTPPKLKPQKDRLKPQKTD